jgi:hypothetical protein
MNGSYCSIALSTKPLPDYDVIELAADPRPSFGADWRTLSETGSLLGRVPVTSIFFDSTRRRAVKAYGLAEFLR